MQHFLSSSLKYHCKYITLYDELIKTPLLSKPQSIHSSSFFTPYPARVVEELEPIPDNTLDRLPVHLMANKETLRTIHTHIK